MYTLLWDNRAGSFCFCALKFTFGFSLGNSHDKPVAVIADEVIWNFLEIASFICFPLYCLLSLQGSYNGGERAR